MTVIPYYEKAFQIFDERYPEEFLADKWRKLRVGYSLAYEDFFKKFRENLDLLINNNEGRKVYLKRIFKDLYHGPNKMQPTLEESVAYFESREFEHLKSSIDISLWNELDEIGYALSLAHLYQSLVDALIESELATEGIPILSRGQPLNNEDTIPQGTQNADNLKPDNSDESNKNNNYNDTAPESRRANECSSPGFDIYIEQEHRNKLIPFLKKQHKTEDSNRPRHFACMLFALHTLTLIPNPASINQKDLFEAIKKTFNVDWTQQALNRAISILNGASVDKELKIKHYAQSVKAFLQE